MENKMDNQFTDGGNNESKISLKDKKLWKLVHLVNRVFQGTYCLCWKVAYTKHGTSKRNIRNERK